jgi:hypothetical protein
VRARTATATIGAPLLRGAVGPAEHANDERTGPAPPAPPAPLPPAPPAPLPPAPPAPLLDEVDDEDEADVEEDEVDELPLEEADVEEDVVVDEEEDVDDEEEDDDVDVEELALEDEDEPIIGHRVGALQVPAAQQPLLQSAEVAHVWPRGAAVQISASARTVRKVFWAQVGGVPQAQLVSVFGQVPPARSTEPSSSSVLDA